MAYNLFVYDLLLEISYAFPLRAKLINSSDTSNVNCRNKEIPQQLIVQVVVASFILVFSPNTRYFP